MRDKSFAHRACSTNGCLCDRRDDHAGDGTEDHAARCCDCFDSALVGRAVTDTCCQTAGCHHAETPEQGRGDE